MAILLVKIIFLRFTLQFINWHGYQSFGTVSFLTLNRQIYMDIDRSIIVVKILQYTNTRKISSTFLTAHYSLQPL